MLTGAQSERGKRAVNEDSFLTCTNSSGLCLAAVSDGMGGHAAGDVASRIVVDSMQSDFEQGRISDEESLVTAVARANASVYRAAVKDPDKGGMGATLVTALADGEKLAWANVGDSRLYHYSRGKLTQLSKDHSYVQTLVDAGIITPEQALTHPRRNIIMRAMGTEIDIESDSGVVAWQEGDTLLLCSDGLTGVVPHDRLRTYIKRYCADPLKLAKKLSVLALAMGSTDNVTVVIVRNDSKEAIS